jgi:hypothetical protein
VWPGANKGLFASATVGLLRKPYWHSQLRPHTLRGETFGAENG